MGVADAEWDDMAESAQGGDMADVERILIIGGGIAGLTVATALYRHGFAPELVERSVAWPAMGAGINLPANRVRVLRALGLGEAVERAAEKIRRWSFFDQEGKLLCETDLHELWREVGPCLGITRVKLQEALLAGAAAVRHRLGISLTSLTQDRGCRACRPAAHGRRRLYGHGGRFGAG